MVVVTIFTCSKTVTCDRLSDPADASLSPVGLANEDANDWIVLHSLLIQQASNTKNYFRCAPPTKTGREMDFSTTTQQHYNTNVP